MAWMCLMLKSVVRSSQGALILMFFVSVVLINKAGATRHPCAVGTQAEGTAVWSETPNGFRISDSDQVYVAGGVYYPDSTRIKGLFADGQDVEVFFIRADADRYGRIPVQVFSGGQWLTGQALARGHAVIFATGEDVDCRTAMLGMEKQARLAKQGFWRGPEARHRADDTETLLKKQGQFGVVEGKVLSVGDRKTRLYLNFGKKWSQDFTVLVVKKGANAFKGDINMLKSLGGKRIRIRGIVEEGGGPMIRVVREGQIEVDDP